MQKKRAFELEFLTSFLVIANHHLVPHLFSRRIPPEVNVVLGELQGVGFAQDLDSPPKL